MANKQKNFFSLSFLLFVIFFFSLVKRKVLFTMPQALENQKKKKKTVNPNFKCLNHISLPLLVTSANKLSCTKNVHCGISM